MTTETKEANIIHALDSKLKTLCGKDWEWGWIESDFIGVVSNSSLIGGVELCKCSECILVIDERVKG